MDLEKLVEMILAEGAAKATVIPGSKIVTSRAFRDVCAENTCGNYGRCWMCPPDTGDIDELIETVKKYPQGLLYQTISELEDSFDIEGMQEAGNLHAKISRKVEKALKPLLPEGYLHLINGGCHYCKVCAKKEGKPCVSPENAMPSLEGYGVDVYNTTKDTDLKYINGQDTVTFFSMILLPEENDV
ncbi:DUF2284 domain-containing protein [Neglectibacter caecimuris]|uniref:DUF2284 domain-containing protein n=1 Tax=Neglectibacter caecimuris TaxID=3093658 RepID=UPI002AC9B223|nr:DUF2284 domain-containing protein [Neglectibacter sp. M00184]